MNEFRFKYSGYNVTTKTETVKYFANKYYLIPFANKNKGSHILVTLTKVNVRFGKDYEPISYEYNLAGKVIDRY